jgi:Cof subfamily protein (haloacid dehalogenase superfamily)
MNGISLVISDVDGTLVTPDKRLTDASVRAVRLLRERGIDFTVNSSRPPMGIRMLIEPLSLRLPIGIFNGSAIVGPGLEVIERHFVPEPVAHQSLDVLTSFNIDIWIFTTDDWLVRNPRGDYVPLEMNTIQAEPSTVTDFTPYLGRASKIVGASTDFAKLTECEAALRNLLHGQASVARSQPYYLDITAPGLDKGTFIDVLASRLGISHTAIAVLGDMENDVAMFRKARMSIAMGNATSDVKRQANYVTASNAEDGFALAIERCILNEARESHEPARDRAFHSGR